MCGLFCDDLAEGAVGEEGAELGLDVIDLLLREGEVEPDFHAGFPLGGDDDGLALEGGR